MNKTNFKTEPSSDTGFLAQLNHFLTGTDLKTAACALGLIVGVGLCLKMGWQYYQSKKSSLAPKKDPSSFESPSSPKTTNNENTSETISEEHKGPPSSTSKVFQNFPVNQSNETSLHPNLTAPLNLNSITDFSAPRLLRSFSLDSLTKPVSQRDPYDLASSNPALLKPKIRNEIANKEEISDTGSWEVLELHETPSYSSCEQLSKENINHAIDQKYELALKAVERSLRRHLAHFYSYDNRPEDLLRMISNFSLDSTADLGCYNVLRLVPKEGLTILTHLLEILIIKNPQQLSSQRYDDLIITLRKALKSDSRDFHGFKEILDAICLGKFTQTVLTNYEDALLAQASGYQPVELTRANLAATIDAVNKKLPNYSSNLMKARGQFGFYFDPHRNGNPAELRSTQTFYHEEKLLSVQYLRFGTPTTDGFRTPTVIPEFEGFLRAFLKPFLYVNHQKLYTTATESTEKRRSEAIQNLQWSETNPNGHKNFYFLSLPFDGSIFEKLKQDSWKQDLVNALLRETDGFRLPLHLNKGPLAEDFSAIANKIHELYFKNGELSKEQRRVFLMIFYHYVKEYVKIHCKIEAMVSACKDNKDRGGASGTIDEALYDLRLGHYSDPRALNDLYVRALAPYMIKFEHIIPHRLDFLLVVLEHLATLNDQQIEKITQYNAVSEATLVQHDSPREGVLSALPLSPNKENLRSFFEQTQNGQLPLEFPENLSQIIYGSYNPETTMRLQGFRDPLSNTWDLKKLQKQLLIDVTRQGFEIFLDNQRLTVDKVNEFFNHLPKDEQEKDRVLTILACLQQNIGITSFEFLVKQLFSHGLMPNQCPATEIKPGIRATMNTGDGSWKVVYDRPYAIVDPQVSCEPKLFLNTTTTITPDNTTLTWEVLKEQPPPRVLEGQPPSTGEGRQGSLSSRILSNLCKIPFI